jgi:hypothetical protein
VEPVDRPDGTSDWRPIEVPQPSEPN